MPSQPADIYPDVIVAGQITYEPGFGHDLTFRSHGPRSALPALSADEDDADEAAGLDNLTG